MDTSTAVVICVLLLAVLLGPLLVLGQMRRLVLDMQRQNEVHTYETSQRIAASFLDGVKLVMFGNTGGGIAPSVTPSSGNTVTDVDTQATSGQEWAQPGHDEGLDVDPTDEWADVDVNDRSGRAVVIRPGEDPLSSMGVLPARDMGGEDFPEEEMGG